MKTDVADCSETLVSTYQTTRRHIPEHGNLNIYGRANLVSHIWSRQFNSFKYEIQPTHHADWCSGNLCSEGAGWNLDRDTGWPDWGSLLFSSVPPGKYQDITSVRARLLPSKSVPVHYSSYHSTLGLWSKSKYWEHCKINHNELTKIIAHVDEVAE
jgi:hypothetical protein